MDTEKIFQERLRSVRNEQGISQKQVAAGINITEVGYRNYEGGRRKPNFDVLVSLASFFNISLDYLVGLTNNPSKLC